MPKIEMNQADWLPLTLIKAVFGLQKGNLVQRGVAFREGVEGRLEYRLSSMWANCGDLLLDRLSARLNPAGSADYEALRLARLAEDTRRLKLANDQTEGLLVLAEDVEITFSRSIRAMADELDAVVSRVKMACPDIPQAALAVIADQLAAARRKAARIDFENLPD